MPDPSAALSARLHALAHLLREFQHMDPPAQKALAELVEELASSLQAEPEPSEEVASLAESTAHLAEALHQKRESGPLASARDRLEQATLAAETNHPVLAGLAQRLVETLSNLGI